MRKIGIRSPAEENEGGTVCRYTLRKITLAGREQDPYAGRMLIIAIIVFGILVGGLAQMVLGRRMESVNWTVAIVAGLLGSLLGGLVSSLIAGDGIELRASGLIGSFLGALVVTAAWGALASRKA